MEPSIWYQDLLWWVMGLVIGLPVLIIFLGEVVARLEQHGNPLAQGLRQARYAVIPLLAAFFIVRQILGMSRDETWVRGMETLVWVVLMVCGLTLIRNLSQLSDLRPELSLSNIPVIFYALVRVLATLLVAGYVLSGVWGVDLSNLTIGLGVGSVVVALALQDTLSNLVSGFLLIADRPFKVGDWCEISGQRMEVREVGWRTTRFASFENRGLLMIPNGSLGKEVITNLGQHGTLYTVRQRIGFSYDDPPNHVKQVLLDVLLNIDEIVSDPPPRVILSAYLEYAIEYRMDFVVDFRNNIMVQDRVRTQLYYAARRHHLTIPLPVRTLYHEDRARATPADDRQTIIGTLQTVPLFQYLPAEMLHELAATATVRPYGASERVIQQGVADDGLYVIQSGWVMLSFRDQADETHEIASLSDGDIFGEMALLRSEPSPFSATVSQDAAIITLDHATINRLIVEHTQFASEMNLFIDERRRVMYDGLGIDMLAGRQSARAEVFNLLSTAASQNGE